MNESEPRNPAARAEYGKKSGRFWFDPAKGTYRWEPADSDGDGLGFACVRTEAEREELRRHAELIAKCNNMTVEEVLYAAEHPPMRLIDRWKADSTMRLVKKAPIPAKRARKKPAK